MSSMSHVLLSTEERIQIANIVHELYASVDDWGNRWRGIYFLYKNPVGNEKIVMDLSAYEAHVWYEFEGARISIIRYIFDDNLKSTGALYSKSSFSTGTNCHDMQIHEPSDYNADNYELINQMNNTFSTGYLPEEEYFQYSTLFQMPEYEHLYDLHSLMNRAIGTSNFIVMYSAFNLIPMRPMHLMELVKKGIEDLC